MAETIGELACAIVPDPDGPGRRAALERAVPRRARARGSARPSAGPRRRSASTAPARRWRSAAHSRACVAARDRAGELLLRADPVLAAELARDKLAPLAELSAGARARLTQTLTVWLAEQGRPGPVADAAGHPPQTARYRIARLRELFGRALDDPDQRFWLEVALRVST